MILDELQLWMDPCSHNGPEAMAIDEWLLETTIKPVLRIYSWSGDWGSLGYFRKLRDAEASFPNLSWVRRRTGGGIVDHSADWTYSLAIPRGEKLASATGGESYREIHEAVLKMLVKNGEVAALSEKSSELGGVCFSNPVEYDVLGGGGEKIAGAAQRRSAKGLLHQGSISRADLTKKAGKILAGFLARNVEQVELFPPPVQIKERVSRRYGTKEWLHLR